MRVGVAVISETFAQDEYSIKTSREIHEILGASFDIELVHYKDFINCREDSKKAGRFLRDHGVDAVIVYLATYSQDNLAVDIVYPLDCPVALWPAPEPLKYPWPEIGAFCGMTQIGGVFTKFGVPFVTITGDIGSTEARVGIDSFLSAAKLVVKLKYAVVGMIGSRSDGMVENVFNELELRKQVGPEIVHISLHTFFENLKAVSDSSVEKEAEQLVSSGWNKGVGKQYFIEALKIEKVLKNFVGTYKLDGLSIRCWPELKEYNVCSPCYALSAIHESGIPTACEADITALISMLIGDHISKRPSFLTDLMKADEEQGILYYYHCGAANRSLCSSVKGEYALHPVEEIWKPGVIVQFPFEEGDAVCCRLGEKNGKFQLVAYTGKIVEPELFVMGNTMKLRPDKSPRYIVDELISHGTEHHQITFYSSSVDVLALFSMFSGIPLHVI